MKPYGRDIREETRGHEKQSVPTRSPSPRLSSLNPFMIFDLIFGPLSSMYIIVSDM